MTYIKTLFHRLIIIVLFGISLTAAAEKTRFGGQNEIFFDKDGSISCLFNGTIVRSEVKRFIEIINKGCTQLTINSPGGDVEAAFDMGRIVRRGQVSVTVPSFNGLGQCASSCVFIYAAGIRRLNYGPIKIHRPYLQVSTDSFEVVQKKYRLIETKAKIYLREMNVSESLFDRMMEFKPEETYTLSIEEMQKIGMGLHDPVYMEYYNNTLASKFGFSKRDWMIKKNNTIKNSGDIDIIYMPKDIDRVVNCWKANFPEYSSE